VEKKQDPVQKFPSTVAKIFYTMKMVRGETLLAMQILGTRVKYPKIGDMQKLERVLGFL
jgi:hypothetical protein